MAIIENQRMYNFVSDAFKATPEEIKDVLKWREKYLEKKRELNRKYKEKNKDNEQVKEAQRQCQREYFQKNKALCAARQKAKYDTDPEYRQRVIEYSKNIMRNRSTKR